MKSQILKIIDKYAKDCLSGKIIVGQQIKFACERHFRDLERNDIVWKEEEAARAIGFIQAMRHVKGTLCRRKIVLEPWQIFFVGSIYGWYKKDSNARRFREAHLNIARKSGKSSLASAIGHYGLVADREMGADIVLAASKEEQAKEIFGVALQMVHMNPEYKKFYGLKTTLETIRYPATGSSYTFVIGAPSDGGNPHYSIIDEYHQHKNNAAYEALKNGQGSRKQPLMIVISTAGMDFRCAYKRYMEYCQKVMAGIIDDDTLFSLEYSLDDADDWKDFSVWTKANPNLGISVNEDFLYSQYKKAMSDTTSRSSILTKHCNVWNNASSSWIDMAEWQKCALPGMKIEDFAGEPCWCGLDLASRVDLCSLIFVFRRNNEYYIFGKHYLNKERVLRPENHHLRAWEEQGYLITTDGAQTDFNKIEYDLKECASQFQIQELAYDPREATYLMQHVREWASFPCVEVSQSAVSFSEPMKVLEANYLSHTLKHPDDPLLNWAASNVILKNTTNKLIYPAKRSEKDKIDPIVALIMALGRAELVHMEADFSIFSL